MPGHNPTHFSALSPLLAALALIQPTTAEALLTALGIHAALHQAH